MLLRLTHKYEFNDAADSNSDDMRLLRAVMKRRDINRPDGYSPLAKTEDVRQRSLRHHMHYRDLRSGILR